MANVTTNFAFAKQPNVITFKLPFSKKKERKKTIELKKN